MDVAFLLDKYFKGAKNVSIDVFDAQTLNAVYKDVVNKMTSHLWQGTLVYMVSNSFADECIAKLLLEMPLNDLKQHTTFRGLNPLAERSVLVALQRRYNVIKSEQ